MKNRLTKRDKEWYWKNEEYWVSAEEPTANDIDKIYYALAEYEDFMEQNGFESLEELGNFVIEGRYAIYDNLAQDNLKERV